jgi:hypothetical protein
MASLSIIENNDDYKKGNRTSSEQSCIQKLYYGKKIKKKMARSPEQVLNHQKMQRIS